jgi:hypothetical protein
MTNKKPCSRSNKKRSNKRRYGGGDVAGSTSNYATQVYGSAGQQSAMNGSNVIKSNYVTNCSGGAKRTKRNKRKTRGGEGEGEGDKNVDNVNEVKIVNEVNEDDTIKTDATIPEVKTSVEEVVGGRNKRKGGNIVTNLAVPAFLLTANQLYGRNSYKSPFKNQNNYKTRKMTSKFSSQSRR